MSLEADSPVTRTEEADSKPEKASETMEDEAAESTTANESDPSEPEALPVERQGYQDGQDWKDDTAGSGGYYDDEGSIEHDVLNDIHEAEYENYGYEEAAPEIQRRNHGHIRRNSMVGRIMVWAGAVNDGYFYESSSSLNAAPPVKAPTGRRASMDGNMGNTSHVPMGGTQQQRRRASNDDVDLYDNSSSRELDDDFEDCDDLESYNDDDSVIDNRAPRRNSLHAMVERAMAYVNMNRDSTTDDRSPFGNRRDSLF